MAHKKSPSAYGEGYRQPMWLDKNGNPTFEMPAHVAKAWQEVYKIMAEKQCSQSQAVTIYLDKTR